MTRALAALAAAAAIGTLALPLGPAALSRAPHASRLEVQDPREGSAPLDMKEVDAQLAGGELRFTVLTWSPWRTSSIVDRGYFVMHVDPRSGRRYYALVRSTRRRMIGILYRKGGSHPARLATLKAWRNDRRSVSVRIPAHALKLETPGAQYAWRVQALVTTRHCERVCFDLAPDRADAIDAVPAT